MKFSAQERIATTKGLEKDLEDCSYLYVYSLWHTSTESECIRNLWIEAYETGGEGIFWEFSGFGHSEKKNYKRFCEELLKLLTTWPAPLKFRQQNSGVRSAARREKKKERLLTRFQESFKILDLHPLLRSCTVLYLCAGLKILTDTTQLKDLQVKS